MNREIRRLSKKEQGKERPQVRPGGRKKRTRPLEFARQVRGELQKVSWPTRKEVVTYSIVVVVTVAFFMSIIGGLDYVFSKGVLEFLRFGGGS